MAAKIDFPYYPANKFHAGIKARFEAAAETPQAIDRLTDVVDTGSAGNQVAVGKVAHAIDRLRDDGPGKPGFDRLATAVEAVAFGLASQPSADMLDKKLTAIGDVLKELHATVQSLGLRNKDNVTALYAAAIDTSGDIVGRTYAGQWLNQANFKTLQDIVKFNSRKQLEVRRQDFVDQLRAVDPVPPGLPAVVTDGDLARFYELAPAVLKAINDSQVASSPQSQQPSGAEPPSNT
ncbi:hypothetical protein SAMN03159463_02318 [Mesorhizobium sp. NFR06]|uniref:hypothetical protein n=1 Tax=Mesorhizobium sp. NFR06 TaxID=1566290 RepID=UPI0008F0D1D8|nr:hypothetical protein [Mesorhizobium sp. NFR06]SFO57400.1 hypothetical protein SAMN03159463_02318 [Mesorhizobium sp. NFR06]